MRTALATERKGASNHKGPIEVSVNGRLEWCPG